MASTRELLVDSLRDILDAEKQAVKSFSKLNRAASSPELKQCLGDHFEVTKGQITRLEQIFEMLGERAKSKPCKAMQGLIAETIEHIGEHSRGSELDSVLIASAQKVEHYEIASYGTARAMAKAAGEKDAANLLQETLKEEGDADKLLTKVAIEVYRQMAREEGASEAGIDEEEASIGKRTGGQAGSPTKVASKKKVAAKTSGGKAASSKGSGTDAGSNTTVDHAEIQRWAEERGAHPAHVRGTGKKGDMGLLRLDFPGFSGGDSLEEISWEDFFSKFDEQGLALIYQETTAAGERSNFNKLVSRAGAEEGSSKQPRKGAGKRTRSH